jgi:prevent-host-death family protein
MVIERTAMRVTATEAKNRLGYFCSRAKLEPIIIEKDGRPDSVILGYEEFQQLKSAGESRSLAARKKAFNETYREWLAAQKDDFEENGLWCEGLVAWQQD